MNSTNGMNGGKKNENLRELATKKKQENIVLQKGRITMTYLGKSTNPTTYNFSMEKEMIMSEI